LDVLTPAEQMQNFVDALEHYGADSVLFTYPNNDVDPSLQIKIMEEYAIRNTGRVKIIPSLGKIRYLSALHYVAAVAGNSSGGIVEVPSMHIPTLDVGIRQRGRVAAESVFHCGSSTEEIEYGLRKIMSAEFRDLARTVINPYYRENTLELMSNAILSFPFKTFKTKKFYDLPGQC
jgi:UDP-N-acetylglucosamine 2-epimerase (non-hydrolysing)/GDP/UDP-N,N'-diacetylbacillosamine 2-epimerase (hydrolysing)